MELKVWVEGIQRVVCGVSDSTTCQDVVYALAHATGKTGRFTLIERWRNSERLLAPNEYPRKILLKWGEYSSDVQFILQRNSLETRPDSKSDASKTSHSSSASESPKGVPSNPPKSLSSPQTSKDIKKSLTFSGSHSSPLHAAEFFEQEVCSPHPQCSPHHEFPRPPLLRPSQPPPYEMVRGNPPPPPLRPARVPPPYSVASQHSKIRFKQVPDRQKEQPPPYREPPMPPAPSHPSLIKLSHPKSNGYPPPNKIPTPEGHPPRGFNRSPITTNHPMSYGASKSHKSTNSIHSPNMSNEVKESHRDSSQSHSSKSSLNGHTSPTMNTSRESSGDINDNILLPYTTSKAVKDLKNLKLTSDNMDGTIVKKLLKDLITDKDKGNISNAEFEEVVIDGYYKNLVKLVNVQRDKLSSQQIDLTKCEAEISYLEGRCKEEDARLSYIRSEIEQLEKEVTADPTDEIQMLENSLSEAQLKENSTKEELNQLKQKLSQNEVKLSQLRSQWKCMQDQLSQEMSEQKRQIETHNEQAEMAIRREIDKLHQALQQATDQAQITEESADTVTKQMDEVDEELNSKRNQIEALKEELKEANLEALTMTPADEKNSPEGINRRIKGSPRQLETAVPTSQNPHGVWV